MKALRIAACGLPLLLLFGALVLQLSPHPGDHLLSNIFPARLFREEATTLVEMLGLVVGAGTGLLLAAHLRAWEMPAVAIAIVGLSVLYNHLVDKPAYTGDLLRSLLEFGALGVAFGLIGFLLARAAVAKTRT